MSEIIKSSDDFKLPTAEELKVIASLSPELGKVLIDIWAENQRSLMAIKENEHLIFDKNAKTKRIQSILAPVLGTLMATIAFALGAFGIQANANLWAIAALITPIAGLAGVLIWGYQKSK
jgi:hypothetical protein